MSYIRAKKVEQLEPVATEHGFALYDIDFEADQDIDCELDSEQLAFVLGLIAAVNELAEGEALVVWKEIF